MTYDKPAVQPCTPSTSTRYTRLQMMVANQCVYLVRHSESAGLEGVTVLHDCNRPTTLHPCIPHQTYAVLKGCLPISAFENTILYIIQRCVSGQATRECGVEGMPVIQDGQATLP
jgi:hypothetical protein